MSHIHINPDLKNKPLIDIVFETDERRKEAYDFTSRFVECLFNNIQFDLSYSLKYGNAENINLSFDINKWNYAAFASTDKQQINVNIRSVLERKMTTTLIHEFAHHIAHDFEIETGGAHCLEFAIVTYCLEKKLLADGHKTFFNSYDIHEDPAFPYLSINAFHFDTLINNIIFSNIQELAQKAKKLANAIREKAIPLELRVSNG
ncbi:hypothetical protein [Burkholderia sp. BCC0097]|uniref:hypothetical protein n=1 Tax=Burkholderia sp. BCC0097 TaxID=2676289 RepID=UPI0015884E27|nr:hypothetical protein [Burkholderia sp. BCC0097]